MTHVPVWPSPTTHTVSYAAPGLSRVSLPPRTDGVSVAFVLFCVLLPLASNFFELALRMCTEVLFDPFPTPLHALLAVAVPAINLVAYLRTRQQAATRRHWLRFWVGISIGSSIYFSIMFAPMMPAGIPGIIVLGLGLLVFGPAFGLLGAVICLRRISARSAPPSAILPRLPFATVGGLLALTLLGTIEARKAYTHHYLREATRPDTCHTRRAAAVQALRSWGSERELFDVCVGRRVTWGSSCNGWTLLASSGHTDVAAAASAYFRVTGRSPDEVDAGETLGGWRGDSQRTFSRDWNAWLEEDLRGRDVVGRPIPGLALASSSMTGTVHADAATAYFEWVLEFDNQTVVPQEARCRVALPPGGVVSRVTLWINGEEREAAYGGAAQVREAYQSVAVVQRRDPVLVTQSGAGHVMLQCFPVPAKGRMQTKIGVTLPLRLASASEGRFSLPYMVERNFAADDGKTGGLHSISLDAGLPLRAVVSNDTAGAALFPTQTTSVDGKRWHLLSGRIAEPALNSRAIVIAAERRPEVTVAWGADPFADDGRTMVQTLSPKSLPPKARISLVVDGSGAMNKVQAEVADAIAAWPGLIDLHIGADEQVSLVETDAATAAKAIRATVAAGGQDAVPALLAAVTSAAPDGLILWVRGPQQMLLSDPAVLQDAMAAKPGVKLMEVIAVPGANLLAADLARSNQLSAGIWEGSLGNTLALFSSKHLRGETFWQMTRAHRPSEPTDANAVKSNIDLARLWARDQVEAGLADGDDASRNQATKLAVAYRLVTAVSGAVVLETQAQYDQHNLSPVSVVPLPPAVWAALLTLPLLIVAKRRMARVDE